MRVNIAYSVEMDSIPKEVCGILPRGMSQEDLLLQIISDLEEENIDSAITNIDYVRKEMFEIDQRLADCSAILRGYLKTKYTTDTGVADVKNALDGVEAQIEAARTEMENDSAI